MNQSKESRPRRRHLQPAPDVLEDRMVLSAGEGSTFAIMPGSVPGPGLVGKTSFKIAPTLFSTPKKDGKILVGIDVTPAQAAGTTTSTSPLQPDILGVKDSSGHMIPVQHSTYNRTVMKTNNSSARPPRPCWSDAQGSPERAAGQRLHSRSQGTHRNQRHLPCRLLPSRRRRGYRHGHPDRHQDHQVTSWT